MKILSIDGVQVTQKNFQQVIIRGNGQDDFNQVISKETSLLPPSKNLELIEKDNIIFAKNSFDQWSLIFQIEKDYKDIFNIIANMNLNENILVSDYSYGQVYFEFSGDNKVQFLNKLTQFDFRHKNFPQSSMAQTLIARVDCSIYNLDGKFLLTCNRSYEDYFKQRLLDLISI